MHAVGLHSALAIKRQRKRRDEQKKARERRFSTQSGESGLGSRSSFASPRNSIASMDGIRPSGHGEQKGFRMGIARRNGRSGAVSGVSSAGMLHIGVVFLVLGLFLVVSGLLPSGSDGGQPGATGTGLPQWAELLGSGIFFLVVGALLVIANRIMARKEDQRLSDYVKSQLTRSKSGHRLVRDMETGNLTAPARKSRSFQNNPTPTTPSEPGENGSVMLDGFPGMNDLTPVHTPTTKVEPNSPLALCIEQELTLEKIEEEDGEASMAAVVMAVVAAEKGEAESRAMDAFNKETMSDDSYAVSLSPGTPSETRELLTGRSVRISRI